MPGIEHQMEDHDPINSTDLRHYFSNNKDYDRASIVFNLITAAGLVVPHPDINLIADLVTCRSLDQAREYCSRYNAGPVLPAVSALWAL